MVRFILKYNNVITRLLVAVSLIGALVAKGEPLKSFFMGMGISAGMFVLGHSLYFIKSNKAREINH
jgi:hypothetical protein